MNRGIKGTDDIVYVCRSLGYKTTIKKCVKGFKDFKGTYHRINIRFDDFSDLPVKLEYKKINKVERQRVYDLTEITIEDLGIGDYYGFELDGNHRFLLEDCTVTHNTSLCLQILNSMSKSNELAVFFSYDMYHSHVIQKLIQKHLKIEEEQIVNAFKNNDEVVINKVKNVLETEYKNVEFCFKTGQTHLDMIETIKHAEEKTGKKCRLAVVDYSELVITDFSDPTQASAHVIQKIREIAISYNLSAIVLLQPSKMTGTPADEIKSYRSAKGSSSIEQACTLMLGMSRPGYDPRHPEDDRFLTISCLKNRMGGLFALDLHWDGLTGTIRSLTDEERDHLNAIRLAKEMEQENPGGGRRRGNSNDSDWS